MSGLYIICLSGVRERLQFAAMAASVAAVSGSEVHVFLSMNAPSRLPPEPPCRVLSQNRERHSWTEKHAPPNNYFC